MKIHTTQQKKLILALILLVVLLAFLVFSPSFNMGKQKTVESVDTELTQYSDSKERDDLKEKECLNPEDCTMENIENQTFQPQDKPVTKTVPTIHMSGKEYGTWVWDSPLQMSETQIRFIVNVAYENKINVLYVTIDDVLDIYALEDGEEKEAQKKAYSEALQRVVRIAKEKGIAVDAEAGWRDWAEADQKFKPLTIVDYVVEYNKTHTTYPLRGLQYDIEPYLLSSYEKNKEFFLTNFVSLVDETATRLGTSNLRFSVVIPHFYDDQQAWTPPVTHKGITQHTFSHIIDILDRRPGSTIILMSYRNFAEGDNGTIQISEVEIKEASNTAHRTKVIVGQETGNVDPEYVTFYGLSKDYYLEQLNIVQNKFKGQSGFGGVAVHYIDPFLKLQ